MQYWVQKLYSFPIDMEAVEADLLNRNIERRKQFYKDHPNGHITLAHPLDLLPEELDKRYRIY